MKCDWIERSDKTLMTTFTNNCYTCLVMTWPHENMQPNPIPELCILLTSRCIPDLSKMVDGLLFLNLPKKTINAWRSNWLPRITQDFLTPVTVCLSPCPSPLAAQRPQRVRGKPRSLCQGGRANGGRGASQEEFVVLAPDAGGWHQGILRSGADQCFDRSWCACSLLLLALMMLLGFGWKNGEHQTHVRTLKVLPNDWSTNLRKRKWHFILNNLITAAFHGNLFGKWKCFFCTFFSKSTIAMTLETGTEYNLLGKKIDLY